ncbi:FAD/NAD(P)-binding domain-containing protein [Heliocybe sulcata]|uniref:FAD/NAD(P)-binding domain-containing protein n=1 Tax=Heliocybe sulcata TaxID=5364 RepID=A0A5C3NEE1_9AGAM|nr:FAD/NAD(P)-binding domain-containing protein [Heliocybe sulcata]
MSDLSKKPTKRVAVIGTGLVGCLAALGIANKFGWQVDIYDSRSGAFPMPFYNPFNGVWLMVMTETDKAADDRKTINLALSARGLRAFAEIDPELAAEMKRIGVPLNGRMVHDLHGNANFQPYGPHNEASPFIFLIAIFSINRVTMINLLKDAVAECPLIKMHFSHKLARCSGTRMEFDNPASGAHIVAHADLIIGADGAYSALREQMRRQVKMDTSTRWAPLSYLKIEVVPRRLPNGEVEDAFDPRVLHIWPRKEFLLIAPSNPDKTFTCVLWAPDALLERLQRDEDFARDFFPRTFPSFMRAISIEDVLAQLKVNPVVPMCAIKCSPLNNEHCVLIGDAAHVIVPYLGHGANVGYEDVRVLLSCLEQDPRQEEALANFNSARLADLEAIDRVSWAHIHELAEHVLQPSYLLRKRLDFLLARMLGGRWSTLYAAITFDTETPYAEVVNKIRRQDQLVQFFAMLMMALIVWAAWSTFVPVTGGQTMTPGLVDSLDIMDRFLNLYPVALKRFQRSAILKEGA